ncbi:hypothetical protein ACGFZB_25970 [Streptomyces cinerochromogenes]|uniref:Uncharacterized protein n=1 Tax=Streptomyces cinerochromogenes TaxID=66422 RepID=A0ABW7BDN4_9ACTN
MYISLLRTYQAISAMECRRVTVPVVGAAYMGTVSIGSGEGHILPALLPGGGAAPAAFLTAASLGLAPVDEGRLLWSWSLLTNPDGDVS